MTLQTAPRIGAFVLDTLTTGMYTAPLDTIREFVQNAADSIRRARENGLYGPDEGRILISLDPHKRTLRVWDNGTGISASEAQTKLLNIGMSDKDITRDCGFRGIGRLAGVAYCETMHFRTRSKAEEPVTSIELDCSGLRRAISPANRQESELSDVISQHALVEQVEQQGESHFFEVILEGITEAGAVFLDRAVLERYLQQVAPVDFDSQSFIFAPVIHEWLRERGITFSTVRLTIHDPKGDRDVFRPYKGFYSTRNPKHTIEIRNIRFFPENADQRTPFWIWYADTDLLGMVDDPTAAGLRFRKGNIAIGGPERVEELFGESASSDTRFNSWFIGEIHILDKTVIPNARRDGFEDVETWPDIRKQLIAFVRERKEEIREVSKLRNRPVQKVVESARKVISAAARDLERGLVSKEERDSLLEKVNKEKDRLKAAERGNRSDGDLKTLQPLNAELSQVEEQLKETNAFALKKIRTDLDRKQRRLLQDILAILRQALEEKEFSKAQKAILQKFELPEDAD